MRQCGNEGVKSLWRRGIATLSRDQETFETGHPSMCHSGLMKLMMSDVGNNVRFYSMNQGDGPDGEGRQQGGTGPLEGYKVLDLSQVVAGNFCGALLGYFGADVIKIEPPGRGDPLRSLRAMDDDGVWLCLLCRGCRRT